MATRDILFNETPGDSESISDEVINLILTAQGNSEEAFVGCILRERDTLNIKGFLFAVDYNCIPHMPQELQDAILVVFSHLQE